MTTAIVQKKVDVSPLALSFAGSILIGLLTLVKIPLFPVSITLHTLAIAFIAMHTSPKVTLGSILFYLAEISCGFWGVSALWFTKGVAGYYLAFPVAGYLMSYFYHRSKTVMQKFGSLLLGNAIILSVGSLVLASFIGIKAALLSGFLIFLPGDIVKSVVALTSKRR